MTEKLTVEQLAKRAGMANVEMLTLAKKAGITFDSPQSEISQEQHTKLQAYLTQKSTKSSGTLSLSGGARPKLSLAVPSGGGGSGPNVVRKRTIVQTRSTEELDRQVDRIREMDAADRASKQRSEDSTPPLKAEPQPKQPEPLETKQTRPKVSAAKPSAAEPEPKPQEEKDQLRVTVPYARGPVPQLDAQFKKPRVATAKNKAPATKQKSVAKTSEVKTEKRQPETEHRYQAPKTQPEKKPRRSRGSSSRNRDKDSNEELQLNEFQRRQGAGRNLERTEPLRSTLLNQEFARPSNRLEKKEITIGDTVQVGELAHMMGIKAPRLIKELMKLKVMATVNQSIDYDTAEIAAHECGFSVTRKQAVSLESLAVGDSAAEQYPSVKRPPVITVMGHVDHGKTSLLDYIRRTKVAEGESGGITQHIGAYHVRNKTSGMTFLDTPGHAAFTAMRARGAKVTDIVILVVAADDKVMPQTIEAIQHARSAQVPIIVALNKIDREEADPDRLINELSAQELVPESWGGDTQFVQVSAHTGKGIEDLLEAVTLQAEILELKAPLEGHARGVVVESSLDKYRGPVATFLITQGTLRLGTYIIAGTAFGRVRAMQDELGAKAVEAGPSMPVEVLGLNEVPEAGEEVIEVANERAARDLIEERRQERKLKQQPVRKKPGDPFSDAPAIKSLPLVIKADTQGSIGAILHALSELENDQLELNIVLSGVGGITESDASIAHATGATLMGFNVRAEKKALTYCEKEQVQYKYYSIIYELIEEVDNALHGLLDPIIEEKILGIAEVRDVFSVSKFGKIAGCMVTEGTIHRNKPIRVLRDNVVIFEGELESLKRFKEDAKDVRSGMECGIGVKNYKDVKVGDKVEVFDRKEKRPTRKTTH